jgi:transcriptional regulator with GAF, ATPase, and Fis domain/tetratricopeptide (TPR) repeat protein
MGWDGMQSVHRTRASFGRRREFATQRRSGPSNTLSPSADERHPNFRIVHPTDSASRIWTAQVTGDPAFPQLPAGYQPRRVLTRARAVTVLEAERDGQRVSLRLDPGAAVEARAELAVLAEVEHPGIARLVDHGALAGGGVYLARAWVEGAPLSSLGAEPGRVGRIVADVCDALEHLHRRGFLHGDVKAANVLVGEGDAPVLIDFGFARALGDDAGAAGSLLHVAPELLLGQTPDVRSDLFSLGVMLLTLLLDRPLDPAGVYGRFPSEPFLDAAEVDPEELPDWARDLVAALLERDPAQRPSGAGLVGRTLRARLGGGPEQAAGAGSRLAWPVWGGREDVLAELLEQAAGRERWTVAAREDLAGLARHAALAAALDGERVRVADLDHESRALTATSDRALWVRRLLEGGPRALAIVHGQVAERVAHAALEWLVRGAARPGSARLIWIAPAGAAPVEGMRERCVPSLAEDAVRAVLAQLLGEDARHDDLAARMHAESGGVAAELQALLDGVVARGWVRVGTDGPRLRAGALPDWLGRGRARAADGELELDGAARAVDEVLSVLRGPASLAVLAAITERSAADVARSVQELVARRRVARAGDDAWRPAPGARRAALDGDRQRELHARAADALSPAPEGTAHAWLAAPGRATEDRLRESLAALRDDGALEVALDLLGWLDVEAAALDCALSPVLRAESALTWALAEDTARARTECAALDGVADARAQAVRERALGQVARLEQRHEDALAHFSRAAEAEPGARGEALVARARLLFERGSHAQLDELVAGTDAGASRRGAQNVHSIAAMSLLARGALERARAALEAELARAERAGDGALEAATRLNLALVARRAGDARTARPLLERARELHHAAGRLHGVAQCDAMLGAIARDAGELAEATRRLDRALEARELLGDAGGVLAVRGSRALVHAARGHAVPALVELAALEPDVRAAGRVAEADLMAALRLATAARIGALEPEALSAAIACLDVEREPRAGIALARAAWLLARPDDARALLERAREAATRLGRAATLEDARLLGAELEGEAADETTRALLGPFDEQRAGALAEEHFRRGRDDRAARLWLALARRSQDEVIRRGASARAAEALGELERGLTREEGAHLRAALLARPDPRPSDLGAAAEEEWDMDVLSILEINRRLVEQEELGNLLGSIVEQSLMLTGAERGFLILEEDGELSFDLAMDSRRGDLEGPEVEASHSVVREALRKGAALRISDASGDPLLGGAPSVTSLDLRSILCQPFEVEPGLRGVVYLDHRGRAGAFGPRAERLLDLLAGQAALAIRQMRRVAQIQQLNARLAEEVVERDTVLVVARRALAERGVPAPIAGLVGETPAMRAVHALLRRVAPSDLSVLVCGDSGTGKELAARALHELSPRAAGPFVSESCAALPATLIESELFGFLKGSFTGAERDSDGLFERASGGTLFLDEVGELPLELQAKLLRVLETREVRRLGEADARPVDFRLVVATNRDLSAEVEEGRFRLDLLYRIDGVRVSMPPLSERPQDIPLLVDHFLRLEERRSGRRQRCADAVLARLAARAWPGNVRELRNEVARLCVLSEGDITDPGLVRDAASAFAAVVPGSGGVRSLAELEKQAILDAIERTGGDKRRAAELLGVSRAKIYQRIKEWRDEGG